MFIRKQIKVAVLATLLLSIVGCDKAEPPSEPLLRSVRYVEVTPGGVDRVRTFTGVSKSEQEAKLSFKVSGTLINLDVSVGDTIESGQLIAQLDASGFQLQLQQAQADLTRASAEQRNSEAAYKRTRELYENENASKTELDAARTSSESSKALFSASQRAVDLARLNVSYTKLVAKDSCSVASKSTDVGENVSIGQEIVRVNCGDQMEVEVSIPENLIGAFKSGTPASIEFDSVPGQIYPGEVTDIGNSATGTTFPVSVRLADSTGLRAGLTAQVGFSFESDTNFTVVPVTAVSEDQDGRFIYILIIDSDGSKGLIKRQQVQVGSIVSNGIEIVEGVLPGDKVVTAGVSVIRDGLAVKVN